MRQIESDRRLRAAAPKKNTGKKKKWSSATQPTRLSGNTPAVSILDEFYFIQKREAGLDKWRGRTPWGPLLFKERRGDL